MKSVNRVRRWVAGTMQSGILAYTGETQRLRYLKEFRATQSVSNDELRKIQLGRIRELVNHAVARCPFYRRRIPASGIGRLNFEAADDIQKLPILDKSDLQLHRDEFIAEGWPRHDMIDNQTGGSTGEPVSFVLSKDRLESRAAAVLRHDEWAGLLPGDKRAYVWGAPRDAPSMKMRNRLRRWILEPQLWLDTGWIDDGNLMRFNEQLKSFRPDVIVAYASAVALLARFLDASGGFAYSPRSIITSAELLTPEDRSVIERVFSCPVFNRYGSREFGVVASECAYHNGLHTMAEGLYIEVIRDGKPVADKEAGSVVVTDLFNFAMPLIRYRIGDVARFSTGPCPCGRGLPRLEQVSGRVTDFLVGTDERLVSGVFLATFVVAKRPSLGQVRLLQDRAGHVTYQIKRGKNFREPDDLDYLRAATLEHLGLGATAEFEFVNGFQPTSSGKTIFSRSTVDHPLVTQSRNRE